MLTEEYLQLFDKNFDNIQALVYKYHPYFRNVHEHTISAPGAEFACEQVRKQIQKENNPPNLELRDPLYLNRVFNDTWFGMPESMEVRYEPGFGVLCDLCSEFPDDIEVDFDEED